MCDVGVIIVAGGSGSRMRSERPKQLLRLGGEPVLLHSVRAFAIHPSTARVVIAAPAEWREEITHLCGALNVPLTPQTCLGGSTRQESVWNGLQALCAGEPPALVAVHDAARPLVDAQTITRTVEAARVEGGAIAAEPVSDTIWGVTPESRLTAIQPREGLRRAQTPQVFRFGDFLQAHERARRDGFEGTDDAAVYQRNGGVIVAVDGAPWNLKITAPGDLELAELWLARRAGR